MGGGASKQKSSASSQPWSAQQPYLRDIYARAQAMSGSPYSYYPGSTVAPRDPASVSAEDLTEQRYNQGSPILDEGRRQMESTVRGDYLNSNPYLDETYDRAAEGVNRNFLRTALPAMESRLAGSRRLGSGAHTGGFNEATRSYASELGNMATDIYGGNYARERGVQDAAMRGAPAYAGVDYAELGQLAGAGAGRENYSQRIIDDLVSRFQFDQEEPYNQVARYSTLVGEPVQESESSSKGSSWQFSI